MPADIMARLRAEGLLPEGVDEEDPPPRAVPRPSAGTPVYPEVSHERSTRPPPFGRLPDMSDPDETDERTVLSLPPEQLASMGRGVPVETPVAFSSSTWTTTQPVTASGEAAIVAEVRTFRRPRFFVPAVIVFIVALLALAFAMVLLGHRR